MVWPAIRLLAVRSLWGRSRPGFCGASSSGRDSDCRSNRALPPAHRPGSPGPGLRTNQPTPGSARAASRLAPRSGQDLCPLRLCLRYVGSRAGLRLPGRHNGSLGFRPDGGCLAGDDFDRLAGWSPAPYRDSPRVDVTQLRHDPRRGQPAPAAHTLDDVRRQLRVGLPDHLFHLLGSESDPDGVVDPAYPWGEGEGMRGAGDSLTRPA